MKPRPPWDTVATESCLLHTELHPWRVAGALRSALPVCMIGSRQKRCFSWDFFLWPRQGWESCEKPNQLRSSQLPPDGDRISLPLICHWPSYKATLCVGAAEKHMSYTGRDCKLHSNDWRCSFFPLLGGEVKTRTQVKFSVEMKEKIGNGSTREANYWAIQAALRNFRIWPKLPKLLFLGQVCYVPHISYSVISFSPKTKLLFLLLFSRQVVSDSWQPQGLQHARLLVPNHLPEFAQVRVQWTADAIQPSHPLSPCPPFALNLSQHQGLFLFTSSGQSIGASPSAAVLPRSTQGWYPWRLTDLIALLSKGLSSVFSRTTVRKHQFFCALPSLLSNSHIHTWLLERP